MPTLSLRQMGDELTRLYSRRIWNVRIESIDFRIRNGSVEAADETTTPPAFPGIFLYDLGLGVEQPSPAPVSPPAFYGSLAVQSFTHPAREVIGISSPPHPTRVLRNMLITARDYANSRRSLAAMARAEDRCRDLLDRGNRYPDHPTPVRFCEHGPDPDLDTLRGVEVLSLAIGRNDASIVGSTLFVAHWAVSRWNGRTYDHAYTMAPWATSEVPRPSSILIAYRPQFPVAVGGSGIVLGVGRHAKPEVTAALSHVTATVKSTSLSAQAIFSGVPELEPYLADVHAAMKKVRIPGGRNPLGAATYLIEQWLKEKGNPRFDMHLQWGLS